MKNGKACEGESKHGGYIRTQVEFIICFQFPWLILAHLALDEIDFVEIDLVRINFKIE